ncbi:hypothetical protein PENTCL1PPCAC_16499 [Pristionchus entomophagus]|uniref:UDP-glucuronosyltransferase n=1 Tax=Pristionchus entomophagus TaxID=358040 RepID=A0AAV5TJ36_9BILA|nr:hypothetical protein PENTCL1PPCAC_16499 [Pristionchus entomophagus]
MYMMHMMDLLPEPLKIDPRIRVLHVNGSGGLDGKTMSDNQAYFAFNDVPMWDPQFRAAMARWGLMHQSCERFIANNTFLADIEHSEFDVALTHTINACPIGIIHQTTLLMDAGDQLCFIQRVKSFIGHVMYKRVWRSLISEVETAAFRNEFGNDFPHIEDLMAKAPLVLVNSNEMYDFARPTLAKIVNIGGIGMKMTAPKPLPEKFSSLIDKSQGFAVMTFGSMAPMHLMPDHWIDAYFHAFSQFPNVQFFIRHENPSAISSLLPPNVMADKWLPQTDLLQHPKCIGLISHGGFNSFQEAVHSGVPIIATALWGDQPRNAHLAVRLGFGVNVHKTRMNRETMTEAVRRLVEDKSLKESAVRLKAMLESRPVSSETLLVRWTEFVAEHK